MADSERPSAEEIIRYEKDPRTKIATLTLDRPDALNAPTAAARTRYADLLHRANIDDEVKVAMLEEWSRTKRAHKHAAWMHEKEFA